MLPMNKKEFEKWTEVRKDGSTKYSFKTSLSATILVFLLYFVVNGYINLSSIDKYIASNVADANAIFITLLMTFVVLFVASKILFKVNEKRYSATPSDSK